MMEPRRAKLSKFKSAFLLTFGAENETRTRDPNLGKVMLYQLSYFRIFPEWDCKGTKIFLFSKFFLIFLHIFMKNPQKAVSDTHFLRIISIKVR